MERSEMKLTANEIINAVTRNKEELNLAVDGLTQMAIVNVVNAAGNRPPYKVELATKARFVYFPLEHQTIHGISGLKQKTYRLLFLLDKAVPLRKAAQIEASIKDSILAEFKDIDIHGGSITLAADEPNGYVVKPIEAGRFNVLKQGTVINTDDFNSDLMSEEDAIELMRIAKAESVNNRAGVEELIEMAKHLAESGRSINFFQ